MESNPDDARFAGEDGSNSGSPFAALPDDLESPQRDRSLAARVERVLVAATDRLNPILVKEARQALKSQQFLSTFAFLLLFGWGWSALGIVLMLPGVYYSPGGPFMLCGYFIILAIPLMLIVPFSTYRSLAAEREDGTFELLSITALSSRQIITGKLGSAILQMLVYYSALSPCIAFTYLLRGVDMLTILAILIYTFFASLLLSIVGLMLATVTRARHWQMLLSVLLILALCAAGFMWTIPFTIMLSEQTGMPFDDADFWLFNLAALMFYASYVALFIAAAAGMISFASDNRATRLRVIMLLQQVLLIGWMLYVWIEDGQEEVIYSLFILGGIHWAAMGSLMSGEVAQLSPRVKRSLPQSFLGRMLFTWLNPGSGAGYTFAVLNLLGLFIVVVVALLIGSLAGFRGVGNEFQIVTFGALCWAYVTGYLGVTRPLVRLIQPYTRAGLLLPVLINFFVFALGCFLPLFLSGWLNEFATVTYTELQITNWFWTLEQAAGSTLPPWITISVLGFAGIVFVVNLVLTYREVQAVRVATPDRVLQEDRAVRGERQHAKHKTPWDSE